MGMPFTRISTYGGSIYYVNSLVFKVRSNLLVNLFLCFAFSFQYFYSKLYVVSQWKDPASGNWWFIVRNSEGVVNFGYWPGSLFNNLADHATELEFGGQVYSPPNQPSPQMGSGHFYPKNAFKTASVSNIAFVDGSNVLTEPENISMVLTPNKPNCYYANYCEFWDDVFRYNTMFGGPGGPNCIEY